MVEDKAFITKEKGGGGKILQWSMVALMVVVAILVVVAFMVVVALMVVIAVMVVVAFMVVSGTPPPPHINPLYTKHNIYKPPPEPIT